MPEHTFTILLIEDNDDHAELVKRSMSRHTVPSRIVHVNDGSMALEYLNLKNGNAEQAENIMPDLILLDLRLPKVGGLDVLQKIKSSERTRSIPTVILTTSRAEQDICQAYRYHVNGYLVKPLDYPAFNELLKEIGNYWIKWNVTCRQTLQ